MNCSICQQAGFLRCQCESAQPFCDACNEEGRCIDKMDAQCVIYHLADPNNPPPPSKLTCLGITNGTSVETILEIIDSYVCNAFNIPFAGVDTRSIHWTPGGPAGHNPKADVILSDDDGQIIVERVDGLFAENDHKVKVDTECDPDYLVNLIVGSTNVSAGITVDVIKDDCQLIIVPSLDIEVLIDSLCGQTSFEDCIQAHQTPETPFDGQDTASISWTPGGIDGHEPFADVNISGDAGNIIVIHSDGLYASGGVNTVANAINGLHLDGSNAKLGGALIENTEIDFATLYQLSLINSPKLSIGDNTAITEYLRVIADDNALAILSTFYFAYDLDNNQHATLNATIETDSTGFAQSNTDQVLFANAGQFWLNISGNSSFSNSNSSPFTGLYGVTIKSGAGDITGNIMSGGYFAGFAADGGDVSEMAGIRIGGVNDPPVSFGGAFTGTIANYYGIFIEDIAGSAFGSGVTNKWAIYQSGASDVNRFFGDVQNAGGGVEFTSDQRVKENIESYNSGLAQLEQISVHEFNYTYKKDKKIVGVIAQELEQILPDAVTRGEFSTPDETEKYTDFRFVDQNRLFYTMLNAIKELSAKVKVLESK